jgi:hypothetical protein
VTNPKGGVFERLVANYLALELHDPDIDRQVKTGAADKGDIRGVKIHGQPLAIEAKNWKANAIPTALREAEVERINKGALAGIGIIKRHGKGQPQDQIVVMTLKDFVAILKGSRAE